MLCLVYSSKLQSIALHGSQGDRNWRSWSPHTRSQGEKQNTSAYILSHHPPPLAGPEKESGLPTLTIVIKKNPTDTPSEETMLDIHH